MSSTSAPPFDPRGKVVVVTGGASGIGKALVEMYARAGAKAVVVSDLNEKGAKALAAAIGKRGFAVRTDVSSESEMRSLIEYVEKEVGPIGLFVANAGINDDEHPGVNLDEKYWMKMIGVHVMQQAFMAKYLIPLYISRGGGHILITASAAGLLTQLGCLTYAVTKHAAVAMAEWLSMTYLSKGVGVSCLCPQGVNTPMMKSMNTSPKNLDIAKSTIGDGVVEPDDCARCVLEAQREGRFLVLPHPRVATYMKWRAADPDRWIRRFSRMQSTYDASMPKAKL